MLHCVCEEFLFPFTLQLYILPVRNKEDGLGVLLLGVRALCSAVFVLSHLLM